MTARRCFAGAAAVLAVAAVACGNRVSHEAVVSAAASRSSALASTTPSDRSATTVSVGATNAVSDGAAAIDAGSGAAAASAVSATRPEPSGRVTSPSRPGEPAARSSRRPLVIGSVGTQSGPVGASINDGVKAVQAWAQFVNAKGGVAGHAVKLVLADDGGDPARHRALIQQLVEGSGVIAFVHNTAPISGQSSLAYLNAKRVPVIGQDGGAQWFYDSPMFFPQAAGAAPLRYVALAVPAADVVPQGKVKLGTLACQEAAYCLDADRDWNGGIARQVGFKPVYRVRASLAQPDFTAECLGARQAGAEVYALAIDSNSVSRIAAACARQGYHPTFTFAAGSVAARMKDDRNLDGTIIANQVAPWFLDGVPAIGEFRTALARFSSGLLPSASSVIGWTSAKLFERVATGLGDAPTSADVLDALWSLRGETLGGLTYPLAFERNHNAPQVACGFYIRIERAQFVSPNGGRIICRH